MLLSIIGQPTWPESETDQSVLRYLSGKVITPSPIHQGKGIVFDRFLCLYVCIFLSLFLC